MIATIASIVIVAVAVAGALPLLRLQREEVAYRRALDAEVNRNP